ncbi:WD40 repeat domain-containing protein [Phototrophicus methaneseepsis]|uniref:WD40 repeat domain-containing protein n=1 Tax=Phototrophicus methaneseepsis TaxID=2710758 RepID=A0A7S8E802_9CHLR|nr:WD40 repeat domain-containing protein [Phototrophicus methaneseepsis]QPC82039.1 WD40 repeat domain-containing protein [Phototrophicus methaneseepsis]
MYRFLCLLVVGFCFVSPTFTLVGQSGASQGNVHDLAISSSGMVLGAIYSNPDSTVVDLFDTTTGHYIESVNFISASLVRIALSPQGDRLLLLDSDSNVRYYDRLTGTGKNIGGTLTGISDIEWSPNSSLVAYSWGGIVVLYDTQSNEEIGSLASDLIPAVASLNWRMDGQYLVSNNYSRNVIAGRRAAFAAWNMETSNMDNPTPTFIVNDIGGGPIEYNPDGNRIAVFNYLEGNNQIAIYNVIDSLVEHTITLEEYAPVFKWNPEGTHLAVSGQQIRIFDTSSWEIVNTISTPIAATAVQWTPDGQHIFNNGGPDGLYIDEYPLAEITLIPYLAQIVNDENEVVDDGGTIELVDETSIVLEVTTNPTTVGSVAIEINGTPSIDNSPPYETSPLGIGNYALSVVAYSEPDSEGLASAPLTITFEIVDPTLPPAANAGTDQTVTAELTGSALVTLDGSGSSDSDGTIVDYVWTEDDVEIATGVSPQVTLPVGIHTITLTVTDDDGLTDTDTVVITVEENPQ